MRERIVLASNNAGKVREFNQLLADSDIEVIPQSEFSVAEIEETGLTFVENALVMGRLAGEGKWDWDRYLQLLEQVRFIQNSIGGVPGVWDCWLTLRGIKTLAVRMARHQLLDMVTVQ
mgnify:CR=1 FL=1